MQLSYYKTSVMQDRGSCLCHNFHDFIFQDSANIEILKNITQVKDLNLKHS